MSYEYKPTKAERKAAELLREKGWRVGEPACPLCGGLGQIGRSEWIETYPGLTTGHLWNDPCPNGCAAPTWFLSGTTAQSWSETLEQNGWTLP